MRKFLAALFVLLSTAPLAAQEAGFATRGGAASRESNVSAARELYATARYDEALALLNGIRTSDSIAASERKTIEQYRSLCLLALGRDQEAETAIAAAVTADPFFVPTEAEASPRVRSAFSDVRSKLLPGIVSARYTSAKQAFDRKDHVAAEQQFRDLIMLIDDPQMKGRLGDMRVLAAGFHDLAAAAAAPPPAPAKPEPTAAAPTAPHRRRAAARRSVRPDRAEDLWRRRSRHRLAGRDSPGIPERPGVDHVDDEGSRDPRSHHRRAGARDLADAACRHPSRLRHDAGRRGARLEIQAGDAQRRPGPLPQDDPGSAAASLTSATVSRATV